ncbi:MAG: hypothetical protein K5770_02360 [Lachnospiraceae bacterium]|nr:hypothetical protein [Lachnospiraceae bacterium]
MRYQSSSEKIQNENDNEKAVKAAKEPSAREEFLSENSGRILRLSSKLAGRAVTKSDDEWSVALMAVSEALDYYDPGKGEFWSYAAVVMKSRLLNLYRSRKRSENEISVSPDAFSGEMEEEDPEFSMKLKLQDKIAADSTDFGNPLRDEIYALEEELLEYNISFFDLTECSPRSQKTRKGCAEVIASFFLPPPLVKLLRKTGRLPARELKERSGQSLKFLDKFRKYLIASALILDGEYPGLSEYVACMKG